MLDIHQSGAESTSPTAKIYLWSSRGFLKIVPVFWPDAKVSLLVDYQKDKVTLVA